MVPHTVIVDFAVALLLTSVGADMLSQLIDEDELRVFGAWALLIGTLAACFAVLSGYAAYSAAAPIGAANDAVVSHRNAGLVTMACFAPLAAWRFALRGQLPQRHAGLYWALAVTGAAALVVTAYLGGTAVFTHGVGVAD